MGKRAIVSGYATVDYAARLPQSLTGPQTRTIKALADDRWPRAGGAPLYVSSRIVAAHHHSSVLVAVGEDAHGAIYSDACRAAGIDTDAMTHNAQARTPWCMLLYHDDGTYTCLIDRGTTTRQSLTHAQMSEAAHADLVCIAAGNADVTLALLECVPATTAVAWIAKRDPISFPECLSSKLARRSQWIFCNASEKSLVDAAARSGSPTGQWIVETRGADGVWLEQNGAGLHIPSQTVHVRDATGAGDTLAGEVLAALLSGESDMQAAVRRGIDAACDLLLSRA